MGGTAVLPAGRLTCWHLRKSAASVSLPPFPLARRLWHPTPTPALPHPHPRATCLRDHPAGPAASASLRLPVTPLLLLREPLSGILPRLSLSLSLSCSHTVFPDNLTHCTVILISCPVFLDSLSHRPSVTASAIQCSASLSPARVCIGGPHASCHLPPLTILLQNANCAPDPSVGSAHWEFQPQASKHGPGKILPLPLPLRRSHPALTTSPPVPVGAALPFAPHPAGGTGCQPTSLTLTQRLSLSHRSWQQTGP